MTTADETSRTSLTSNVLKDPQCLYLSNNIVVIIYVAALTVQLCLPVEKGSGAAL